MFNKDLLTKDTFFKGKLEAYQPKNGYRYSIDSIILAAYLCSTVSCKDTIIDLGTGSGIIPLILAFKKKDINILGIELQKSLADIAKLNVSANNMTEKIKIAEADFRLFNKDSFFIPADVVVSNPPYRKAGSGKINPDFQKAIARHEIKASLKDIIATAKIMLKVSGRFVIIYPAVRMAELFYEMKIVGIEPKLIRSIHSKKNKEAKLILTEGVKGGKSGVKVASPLIIYNDNGSYTQEIEDMLI
ncbi:MAG: methyltransferase [Deltaproteobacteria bacterium]|nr:methyltransferase [Deltaproteobacteria bacterium]